MQLSDSPVSSMRLQLKLVNNQQALEPARRAVLDFLAAQAPRPFDIYKVELILEESLMNIIWHAFEDQGPHQIDLTIELEPDGIVMQFGDDGVEFNPLLAPAPVMPSSIDIAVPGGLGLMLVRKFAQSMSYERTDGRNCLRIRIATT